MKHKNGVKGAYIFLAALTVFCLIFGALLVYPKSSAFIVTGTVLSKNTSQGYGPSGDHLKVKLESGQEVRASTFRQTGARVGERVRLSGYERFIFSPRYQYISSIQNEE